MNLWCTKYGKRTAEIVKHVIFECGVLEDVRREVGDHKAWENMNGENYL